VEVVSEHRSHQAAAETVALGPTNFAASSKFISTLQHLTVQLSMEVEMTAITITLPDDRLLKLKEMATEIGVTPEELVRVSIEELLAKPEDTFKQVVTYVLKKNAELYRRLA
jgi:hypothetical protein